MAGPQRVGGLAPLHLRAAADRDPAVLAPPRRADLGALRPAPALAELLRPRRVTVGADRVAPRLRRRPQPTARMGRHLRDPPRSRPAHATDHLARRRAPPVGGEVVIEDRDADFVEFVVEDIAARRRIEERARRAWPYPPRARRPPQPYRSASGVRVPRGSPDNSPPRSSKGTIHVALPRDHPRRGPLAPRRARRPCTTSRHLPSTSGSCSISTSSTATTSRRTTAGLTRPPRSSTGSPSSDRRPRRPRRRRTPGRTAPRHARRRQGERRALMYGENGGHLRAELDDPAPPAPHPAPPRRRRPTIPETTTVEQRQHSVNRSAATATPCSCGAFKPCAPPTHG